MIRDYASRMPLYREERDALEASFLREAAEIVDRYRGMSHAERAEPLRAFSTSCFERATAATERWSKVVANTPVRHRPPLLFSLAWDRFNREASFPA